MFSIVVPAYEKQDFIVRTIDSVLAQDFTDFELIVVDDGSTDATAALVSAYTDPRIFLVRQKNRGKSDARNTGMERATRSWIALLDADDYWFPDHLSELARIIAAFPEAGMVATSFVAGEAWMVSPPRHRSMRIERINYFEAAAREIAAVWTSAVAIRRDVAADVDGFGPFRRGEDLEYWARAALQTPVARSRRVTAYYFRHAGSTMATDHHRKEIAPDRIEDMWPSVVVTQKARHDPAHQSIVRQLESYERHATLISMKGYVLRGEIHVARRLARQLPGRHLDRAAIAAALLRLPESAIAGFLRLRTLARSFVHR